jgi:hypothetical protein
MPLKQLPPRLKGLLSFCCADVFATALIRHCKGEKP